jgi:hypothetical protein
MKIHGKITKDNQAMDKIKQELSQGMDLLQKITIELGKLDESSQKKDIQAVLEGAVERFGKASEFFLSQDQPWLAAWVDLRRASLLCELANDMKAKGRRAQAQKALELVMEVMEKAPDFPPSLDLTVKLHTAMIEPLFRIRALFEKPDQREAIDDLISAVAENLGEAQAMDLLYRRETADLDFTAGVLDALIEVEEDPEVILKLADSAHKIKGQSAARNAFSSLVRRGEEKAS